MGGCASKPNDLDIRPDSLPSEAPAIPMKAEGETVVAQENVNEKEDPLVDVSESKPADAEIVLVGESHHPEVTGTPNPTEETVENKSEDKAEAGKEETTKPAEEVKQAADVAVTTEVAKTEKKSDAAPIAEDKSDAPLVTV